MTPYRLANVLIVSMIAAILLWMFNAFIPNTAPETQKVKTIVNVIVCVILAVWILVYLLGGFSALGN
jgi:uncharacterized membrane-anchored protein